MKKTIKSLLAIAIAAFAFTACSDVPEPYQIPGKGGGGEKGSEIYTSANLKTGWTLKAITADQPWSQGSSYVQATGYQKWDGGDAKSNRAVEGWLISPAINTTGYENVKFSFDNTIKYTNNVSGWEAYHKVYVSDNYTNDVSTATWVALDFTPVSSPYSDWTLYTSGEIQLPASMVGKSAIHFAFWFKAPANASTTWELMNFKVEEGIANNEPEPEPTPTGNYGTAEAPITVAKALEVINGLEDGGEISEDAYVKGTIVSVDNYNSTYKSITYYISDDGTNTAQLQVYSGKGLNGADFASKDDLKKGAIVVVKGKLKKFVKNGTVTPGINQSSSIVSISNNEGGGEIPTPTGKTLEAGKYFFVTTATGTAQVGTPVAADKDYGYMMLADAKVADGKLANDEANLFTFTAVEGGFTLQDASGRYYYMDDSHKSFQVSATLPTANHIWTATVANDGTATVKNNGTGLVIQYVKKYSEFTPTDSGDGMPTLMKVGDAITTGGGSEGGGNEGGGNEGGGAVSGNTISVTFSDLGLANQQKPSTLTLTDGTTLTFDGGGNTNVPAYYNAGTALRMYPKNTMTIDAGSKKIAGIEIVCIENSGTMCNASGDVTVGETKMTIDGASLKFTGPNAAKATVTNTSTATGAASQIRMSTLKITYAQ